MRATLLCLAGLLTATHASALPFTNVYVFGDSLMDVGNVYTATGGATPPSPPYFNGRWSNGPLAVDQFAADYGVTLKPSVLGGTGYAWGGARAGTDTPNGVPDVIDQVSQFVAGLGGKPADSKAVFVMDGGGNDIVPALLANDPTPVLLSALDAMKQSIQALVANGAGTILLWNVPDVGATPVLQGLGPAAQAGATFLTQQYNAGLLGIQQTFAKLGADVRLIDTFGLNEAILKDPSAFGYTNVANACLTEPEKGVFKKCDTPESYFYWDSFHPTFKTGSLVAAQMRAAVPEPGTLVLVAVALAVFGPRMRRRAR